MHYGDISDVTAGRIQTQSYQNLVEFRQSFKATRDNSDEIGSIFETGLMHFKANLSDLHISFLPLLSLIIK